MVNHTLPLPSRLDAQPVLSLSEVNSFIEEQIQRLPGRKRDKNRQRVNIPAIASLDSRKYRGQVMVSTIRKAKEGVKRRQRLHSKLYSYKPIPSVNPDIERVFGKSNVATITYDNGAEFSSWRATEKTLAVDIYFADPYKSSQRGRNENFNGLIRDFYPKGTDFKKLTAQCILDLENLLNNRPRKRLGGLTPLEVFKANCCG